jgi:hypothetical protein
VEAPAAPGARETHETPPHRPAHDLATGAEIAVLTPELSTELGRSRGMDVFRVDDVLTDDERYSGPCPRLVDTTRCLTKSRQTIPLAERTTTSVAVRGHRA